MLSRLFPYIDIFAIVFLTAIPWTVDAVHAFALISENGGEAMPNEFGRLIVDCFRVSVPVLAIMHLRSVDWTKYGFKRFDPYKDVVDGVALAVASVVILYAVGLVFYFAKLAEFSDGEMPKQVFQNTDYSMNSVIWVLAASAAVAFAEELTMRSYLITRFLELRVSPPIAVVTTSLLFAGYHIYQGLTAVVSIFLVGIILGIYFQRMQRFWPVLIAHFAIDVVAMISNMKIVE